MLLATTESTTTPMVTALVVIAAAVVQEIRNNKKRSKGTPALEEIKRMISDNHAEMRKTCEVLGLRVDEVEALAEDALSQAIGPKPDRKNGLKSRVQELEHWREALAERERARLEQLEHDREMDLRLGPPDRRIGPGQVGSLTPRTT